MIAQNDCEVLLDEDAQQRLAEILDEYLIAIEEGASVDIEVFIQQHREFAVPLRSYLDGLDLIRELADGSREHSHPRCGRARPRGFDLLL